MRFAVVALCWLIATAALLTAVPAVWLQRNVIDADGYARLAQQAATDPVLQTAAADQLSAQTVRLFREHRFEMAPATVRTIAVDYTTGPAFPAQFAEANRSLHGWLLSDETTGVWLIDVAPMLRDQAFAPLFADYNVAVPATLTVPVAIARPDRLGAAATWATGLAVALVLLAIGSAGLMIAAARRRGRALCGLGVAALLAGGAGWAGIETAHGYAVDGLNSTTVDIRQIAGAVMDCAVTGLHQWFNVALFAGGVLVVGGVMVATVGGLLDRR